MKKAIYIRRLIQGVIISALGSLILWKRTDFLPFVSFLISLVIIIGGIAQFTGWFIQKQKKIRPLILANIYILIGLSLILFPKISQYALFILFDLYIFINGIIKLIDSIITIKNKSEELIYSLLPAIFYMIFAIILLFFPLFRTQAIMIIIGVYCLLLGITYLADFARMIIPIKAKQNIKRRIRISLPIFLAAFIPHTVLTKLNKFLSSEKHKTDDFENINSKKSDNIPDLEIFIHVASDGFCAIGHVDICFENELIAYGNYDETSSNSIGIGDGVLIISNKEQYIPFCLNFNKTTIFSFGLCLNEEQKSSVKKRIAEIKSQLYKWMPPYQTALKNNPKPNPNDFTDFSSELYRATDVQFYKFTSGKFKTYFVMSTNCVLLADSIICKAGTDILNINGIISPGTFYEYLETEYLKKDSMVITRKVYKLNNHEKN